MRKFHHLGIPTTEIKTGEQHLEKHKVFVSGYGVSEYNIEWMRFEPGCTLPEIVQKIPHIAFEVDDLEKELMGKNVIIQPNSPSEGIMVAFIEENGAPIEFLQIIKNVINK